jgi:hypothetical protein
VAAAVGAAVDVDVGLTASPAPDAAETAGVPGVAVDASGRFISSDFGAIAPAIIPLVDGMEFDTADETAGTALESAGCACVAPAFN